MLNDLFNTVNVWVQFWGLSPQYKISGIGKKLGEIIGKVVKTGIFMSPDENRSFIIALVETGPNMTIKDNIRAGSQAEGIFWVDFKYEKLPQFCYGCGKLGHDESTCSIEESKEVSNKEKAKLGPWLKATYPSKKLEEVSYDNERDRLSNAATTDREARRKRIFSKNVLEMLAALTVSDNSNLISGKD